MLLSAAVPLAMLGPLVRPGAASADPAAGVPRHYRVVNLGSLGGNGPGEAFALNDRGDVVGESPAPDGSIHPFLWRNGAMTDLGVLDPNHPYGSAIDVNNAGEVVGSGDVANGTAIHAFLWRDGVLTDIGTLGGTFSGADAINDLGQITGMSTTADGAYHAFVWQNGQMTDLGVSNVTDINDHGQLVGSTNFPTGYHGYLMENQQITDLGALPGGVYSEAHAINNRGWIVGDSDSAGHPGARGAYLWRNGTMRELPGLDGTYSTATTINDRGQVLGQSIAGDELRPVLWQQGRVIDLTTRGITSGGVGEGAGGLRDINNSDHIAGAYYFTFGMPQPALFV
ncbi:MAG TPA: hypothetical protein VJT31_14870 [Rugosimonospora sp.]|nr:hypothetical protein [Rugosimonospora sp.]